ncbi:MAG: hypothetical protein KBS44_02935, partial [Clostridiales bacterium]|nr:hypothetical protein [Candidatus Coliplasma equi]
IMLASTLCFVSCASAKKGNLDEISDYVIANYTVTNEYGSFTYAEASGDTATITKFDGSATVEKIVIPEVVDNGTRPVAVSEARRSTTARPQKRSRSPLP